MTVSSLRRKWKTLERRYRETRMFAKAMYSPHHPILAHIIPIRRCNLACAYCNEFDDVSPPVPTEEMLRRVDQLAALGTTIITISGGEPMLHPDLDTIVARIRGHGVLATLITNGYLLVPERIQGLNRAGLDYLQISIDNVNPDDVSKKSLKVLDRKLQWLAESAEFSVTINSVLGGGIRSARDAEIIARRARELGFTSTVGILHGHDGQLQPLDRERQEIYERILGLETPLFSFAQYDRFQKNVARGLPNEWHCRAGARYLYICEDGLVHRCSQQRGVPGIPLARYTAADFEREAAAVKRCAPFCTVSCVHQTAMLDAFREDPHETLQRMLHSRKLIDPAFEIPPLVAALDWMFLREPNRRFFSKLAVEALGLKRPPAASHPAPAPTAGKASATAPDVSVDALRSSGRAARQQLHGPGPSPPSGP